jgi:prepilin-type processing-associated H-X9-DG protein
MNAARRRGLTRPEVLLLLAAGTVVVGLGLPAVAKVRGLSNREVCRNNLKQLGQAALKYADDHAGTLPAIGGGQTPGIIVRLLPYTEHHKLAEALTGSGKSWHDPANAALIATRLPVAQCPDTPHPDRLLAGTIGDDTFKAAPTDYTGVPLITEAIRDIFPPDHDRSSPLGGLTGKGTMGEITDGLSTTTLGILEIADKPNRWQAGKMVSARTGMGAEGTWVANGFNAPRGYGWDGKSVPGPCAMNCSNQAAVYSFHEGGCNFLFADGSVRFLKKDLDVWVFYAIVTRRGGELLSNTDL